MVGKYAESAEALRGTLESHPWATRGPTVLAALQKKVESQRNESVVEDVLAGLDEASGGRERNKHRRSANTSRGKSSAKVNLSSGVVRSTRRLRGKKSADVMSKEKKGDDDGAAEESESDQKSK